MHLSHSIRNREDEAREVWVEPWCHPYRIPPGSVLVLRFEAATEEAARLDSELTPERLVIWFGCDDAPTAELDGVPVEPAWE